MATVGMFLNHRKTEKTNLLIALLSHAHEKGIAQLVGAEVREAKITQLANRIAATSHCAFC
jgi:hypothetical protein